MKLLISILISCFLFSILSAQNKPLEKLTGVLENSAPDFPKNKVFVKTDKDIYAPGEKIWFKAEVLNCLTEGPSGEADLVLMIKAESGEVIVDSKYVIVNGLVSNQITLPSWVPEGNAFLIAYTPNALRVNEATLAAIKPITINLLRNNDYILNAVTNNPIYKPGDELKLNIQLNSITPSNKKEKLQLSLFDYRNELFSEKVTASINQTNEFKFKLPALFEDGVYANIETTGKNKVTCKLPVYTTIDQINVEFYPEGGQLLTNTIQRIVYRATDPFGNPTDISGFVFDQLGNQAGVGKTLKPGLGLISLMPMPGQTYTFKIDSKYGNGQKFEMPKAVLNGCAFTLIKTETDNIKAAIFNTGNLIGQKLTVAAVSNGEIKMAFEIEALQKNSLQIATRDLPLGIVNFVVMDEKSEIVSQRMIFNTPNEDLDIDIATNVKPSETNGEVEIDIDVFNFIKQFGLCNVDVKVVDAQNLYRTETSASYNFLKYPLLTATPKTVLDIYITNIELIANTYKYFRLQDLLDGKDYLEQKQVVNNFTGTVTDKSGARIPNATVMAVHSNNPTLATTTSDENGHFVFNNLAKTDDMVIKAISNSGKKIYMVHLDHSFDETLEQLLLMESFKTKPVYSTDDTPVYFAQNSNLLKLAGSETKDHKPREDSTPERMLQSGSSVLDVIRMIKPFSLKDNQIVFYGTTNSIMNQQGALIVVDGQKMGTSIDALNTVNPFEVVSVNVSTDPVEIQRYTALNSIGIIEIRTRGTANNLQNKQEKVKEEPHVSEFNQKSFPENVWKYQSTLYWKPNAEIDENGKINLKLKLSELKTNFVVQVDLTSVNGIKLHKSSTFSTVKE